MKKILSIAISMVMIISLFSAVSAEQAKNISIKIDGKNLTFTDAKPFMDSNNRVLVAVRAVSEGLGAQVSWDESKQQVIIDKDNNNIILTINSKTAIINGQEKTFDTSAQIKNNRTYVPVRLVAEGLGVNVSWDGKKQTVLIGTPVEKSDDVPQRLYEIAPNSNEKTMIEAHQRIKNMYYDKITEIMNLAKNYENTINNVDYRTIDKSDFRQKMISYLGSESYWFDSNGEEISREQYVDNIIKFIKSNKVICKAEFLTSEDLVYLSEKQGYFTCRGTLRFCIESAENTNMFSGGTKIGQWMEEDLEVSFVYAGNDSYMSYEKSIQLAPPRVVISNENK